MGPDAGETIRLKFKFHRRRIRALTAVLFGLSLDSKNVLHVMADFVREHVGLCKLARRSETLLQLIVKSEIDVNLLIAGAVERAGRRFPSAASRLRIVAEQDELGVMILLVGLRGQDFGPGFLRVVENERNEVYERLFGVISGGIRRAGGSLAGLNALAPATQQCKKVLVEDQ